MSGLTPLRCRDWFFAQPAWFQSAIVLGLVLRLYFAIFTQGTYDVAIWQQHAQRISEIGLINYYHENSDANHPPFISEAGVLVLQLSKLSGIPFRVLWRLPFAMIDAGTTIILLLLLRQNPKCLLIAAAYWLHPLAILYSSYHGNTDSAVAFCVLLSVWFLSQKQVVAGAMILGAGLWIKIPVVLAIPALLLLAEGWHSRIQFLAVVMVTAISTYLPALFIDAGVVFTNILGYHGQFLQTTGGVRIWGWFRVLAIGGLPPDWLVKFSKPLIFVVNHSWQIALALLLVLVWRRRALTSPPEVCATIAAGYTLIYGLSESWAFQYFAWSLPFWFFLPRWFFVLATLLAVGYIYSLYWTLCGNPFLLGEWDFVGHAQWPTVVIVFRDLTVAFFLVSACWFVVAAIIPGKRPESMASPQAGAN
jgi:Glycosyltransferase family 87